MLPCFAFSLTLSEESLLIFYILTHAIVKNEGILELNAMDTTGTTVDYSGWNRKRLLYFQQEVDYYANEIDKNNFKNLQLIASTRGNLKIPEEQIAKGVYLQLQQIITSCLD